jgi:hypothetical protein
MHVRGYRRADVFEQNRSSSVAFDQLLFRRRAVTSWQEVGLEGKSRERRWEKNARDKLRAEEQESRRPRT